MRAYPWIGWTIAAIALGVAAYMYFGQQGDIDPYNPDRMKQMVSVKFTDTGEVIELPRGRFERQLRDTNGGLLDPTKGITNPKTGQPTGFLFDKSDWEEVVARINGERTAAGISDASPSPSSRPSVATPLPTPEAPKPEAPKPDQPK